ncbi:MAG: hypothetical protein HYZ26_14640 [Chloroflexi bacterium]|nr:hypothetical protein [Chloroflexota bacterium]
MAIKFLFLFMDGVGLGPNDPETNPLIQARTPNLQALLDGSQLAAGVAPLETERASLLALDPNLGVGGLPQSATGQAALLTGRNIPQAVGEHYGPKPNPAVAGEIRKGTLFSTLRQRGYTAALLNAYPQGYFDGIQSGKRLYSAIPLAVTEAGLALKTSADLASGAALTADFTGEGWRRFIGPPDLPVIDGQAAGRKLAALAASYDFAFFEYWFSDYAGHRQDKAQAVELMESFDAVLGGLLDAWDDDAGLILLTSDHGNLEDMTTRRHTANPVPGLVIGAAELRARFCANLHALTDVAPAILGFYD